MASLSMRQVWGSIPGSVKSNTVSPTSRHRYDIFFAAVLPKRNDAETGPATRYALGRNTASAMKISFGFCKL